MAIIANLEEFFPFCQKGKRIISIDHGSKKLGIAISSPDHAMSFPSGVIIYESEKKAFKELLEVISTRGICAIVVGLPISMDGTKSPQTLIVEKFAEKLAARTNLPIYMQDERLTSKMANGFLRSFMGMNRKERSKNDDSVAANMILDTVLLQLK